MASPIPSDSIIDGVADSLQQFSIETILSDDRSWTSQQTSLDQDLVERLSDEDLDALSLSEYYLTIAQFKLQQYGSSNLFSETFIFGLGTGLDFDVDVCRLPEGQLVVVKRVKLLTPMHRSDRSAVSDLSRRVRKVLQEVRVLKHPPVEDCDSILNILGVSLEYVSGSFTTPSLVLEYAEFGTLRHYLSQEPGHTVQEKQRLCIQIGKAILTLHACHICHGDIKLDNVLAVRNQDGNVVAKVADFGSSIIIRTDDSKVMYWGTTAYNAPEVRSKGDTQSGIAVNTDILLACDLFSFGLLLFESLHNGVPYWKAQGKNEPTVETALKLGKCDWQESITLQTSDMACIDYFRRAISLSLSLEPRERGDMKSVFAALSGENGDMLAPNYQLYTVPVLT
jgi:serine/threonine protein kinase